MFMRKAKEQLYKATIYYNSGRESVMSNMTEVEIEKLKEVMENYKTIVNNNSLFNCSNIDAIEWEKQ